MTKNRIKTMTTIAMLCALAYTAMFFLRIPIVMFLKYEPKDVIILLGGFLYGPLPALIISVVVSLLEMITVSDTGIWGCLGNILSTCSLVCVASIIYNKRKTLGGAVVGLTAGVIFMTAVMTGWNYLVVPIYMANQFVTVSEMREMVGGMLLNVFIPFNLFKGSVNAVLTMLLFKPVATALFKARLIEPAIIGTRSTKIKWLFIIGAAIIAATILFLCFNPFAAEA